MNIPSFIFISAASAFIPVIAGLFCARFTPRDLKIFLLYLAINCLSNIVSIGLAMMKLNNLWLLHVFTPIQFALFIWIFSQWQKPPVKHFFLSAIPAFTLVWLLAMLFFENISRFNSLTRPLEALVLIGVSGFTLYQLQQESIGILFRKPSFWIASGTLIYFSGMIILYTLSNSLLEVSIETLRTVWLTIQPTVNISANLLFAAGFLCLRPR